MTSAQTTLAAGTDNQAFCYDEQNRLTWASSQSATGPCGAANTAGTLTSQGAPYTASYAYDALNRLTSSPLGTYTYGDPAHLHAATAVGSSYTASYDATGNMTCRAPNSGATCAGGTPTGAALTTNAEGRLVGWQNTPTSPTTTASYAYDGEGHRVASTTSSNGAVISTTDYLAGGLEEVTTAGSTTTLTKYEAVPGVCNVVIVGSGPSESISYVTTDGLGSVSEALDGNGNVTAQHLYGPYGTGRFALGAMPTAKGYTGQEGDATTGLDYYGARYYDPLVGQFTSADTAGDGLNRYAYVHDEPETFTDPTGHFRCDDSGCQRKGGNTGGAGGCTFDCGSGGQPYIVSSSIGPWTQVGDPVAGSASNNWLTTLTGYEVDHECFSDGHCRDLDLYSQRQVCDQTCRNGRNEAAKANQIKSLRDRGTVEKLFGVAFVTIGSLLLGSLVPALRGILRIAIALAGVVAGFSGLPGAAGHIFAQVGAVLSALVTTLYAVLALSSAILFAATLVTDGLRAAVDTATFGLGSVFRLGAGIGLSLIGWALETKGTADLAYAGDQDNMSIGDWCSTYGRGQCQ